ncbi:MAG: metallophosphoesterase [candidate division KSB1 bacterium]|nr:metallophosphoesterase [candidate division KSB1 bacterium]
MFRRKKICQIATLVFLSIFWLFISCGTNTQTLDKDYSLLILSDIHISNDETKDQRLIDMISAVNDGMFENLDMLVITGDAVSSFQRFRDKVGLPGNQRAEKFLKIINRIEIPWHIALGNHDYKIDSDRDSDALFSFQDIDTMEVLWHELADIEPYYAIEHKGWNLLFLNSMRGRYLDRFFDDQQMQWLKNELQKGLPVLLFIHHPVKTDHIKIRNKPKDLISPKIEPEFFSLVDAHKEQIKGIFVGHVHRWMKDELFANDSGLS